MMTKRLSTAMRPFIAYITDDDADDGYAAGNRRRWHMSAMMISIKPPVDKLVIS